jgi:hypothetical protein
LVRKTNNMIPLPPGVTINHEVTIMVSEITVEMLKWYVDQEQYIAERTWHDMKGKEHSIPVVRYGLGRPSHKTNDGSSQHLLRFRQEDAGAALMFLMTFDKQVTQHNMREVNKYVY